MPHHIPRYVTQKERSAHFNQQTHRAVPADFCNRLEQIVTYQYNLSFTLAGPDWLIDRERVDTYSAIRDEACELAASAGYQSWWTIGPNSPNSYDPDNCVVELVDMLHFIVQAALQEHYDLLRTGEPYKHSDEVIKAENVALNVLIKPVTIKLTNAYLDSERTFSANLSYCDTPVQATNKYLGHLLSCGALASFATFWDLCRYFNVTADLLMTKYFAKYTLNLFRKHNNYKGVDPSKPAYVKVWLDGREDNAHLMTHVDQQLASGVALTTDDMYSWLTEAYQENTQSIPV
jgi:hypothetical protein